MLREVPAPMLRASVDATRAKHASWRARIVASDRGRSVALTLRSRGDWVGVAGPSSGCLEWTEAQVGVFR